MNKTTLSLAALIAVTAFLFWYKKDNYYHKNCDGDVLIVGTETNYPPFSTMENDEIVGFDIDVATEVAKRLGKKIQFEDMSFDALVPQLQHGRIHIIAAGMSPTPERAQRVAFTKPHVKGNDLIAITLKKHGPIKTLDDLSGKNIAVNEGYAAELYMDTIQGPQLVRLPTPPDAFLALQNEQVYAFVTAQPAAKPFFDQYSKEAFNIFNITDAQEDIAFAVAPNDQELLNKIQRVLDEMEQDGTVENLKQKWGLK